MSNQMMPIPVITIDGPGGTGKGTLARKIAKALDWHFLDSGALYRLLAFAALKADLSLEDENALSYLSDHLKVDFKEKDHEVEIIFENQNVTEKIATEIIAQAASKISVFPKVRIALLERQRMFRRLPGLVADGRDMGTVIFPDADLKIFLTASREERAKRRFNQLKRVGINVSLPQILDELAHRDLRDETRKVSPLKPAIDAVVIDTTSMTVEDVYLQVMEDIKKKWPS